MNDIGKIGAFIQQLRKEKHMTQKELAVQLDVTDKAVSKWERGLSCPDIALIIPLAKLLDVTASELLNGEKNQEPVQAEAEKVVEETLLYSDKNSKSKLDKFKKYTFIALTALCLIAAAVCLLCDYCITGGLTWSYITNSAIVFGWFLLLPFWGRKEKMVKKELRMLSILIIPYLVVLSWCLDLSIIWKMGSCIAVVSIVALWCIYAVCLKMHDRKLRAAGVSFLLLIPTVWGIQACIRTFAVQAGSNVAENVMNTMVFIILALICFGMDFLKSNRRTDKNI